MSLHKHTISKFFNAFVILLTINLAAGCKNPLQKGGGTSSGGSGASAPSSPNSGPMPPENKNIAAWPVYMTKVHTTPPNPRSVVIADFNLDGRKDIVTANQWDSSLAVFLGDSNKEFGARSVTSVGVGEYPSIMTSGDFNADGLPDIAVTLPWSNRVKIFTFTLATGTLLYWKTIDGLTNVYEIKAADMNNDGKMDLVASQDGFAQLNVFIQQPDSSFTGSIVALNSAANDFVIKDFNGDGKKDIVTIEPAVNKINFLAGLGNGTFLAKVAIDPGANVGSPYGIDAGDLNGDGKLDLVYTNAAGFDIVTLLGNGNGTFQPAVAYNLLVQQEKIALGDTNGDGKPDIITINSTNNMLMTLTGKGDGTFETPYKSHFGFSAPYSFDTGDLNDDFITDVVVANYNGDSISIVEGKSGLKSFPVEEIGGVTYDVIAEDFNKDGNMDFVINDISSIQTLVYYGDGQGKFPKTESLGMGDLSLPYALASADFNKDGFADIVIADYYAGALVAINNKDGTFKQVIPYFGGTNPADIVAGDFDKDGNMDFATLDSATASPVHVQYGLGNGTFTAGLSLYTTDYAFSLVAADFNGDGFTDFSVANSNEGKVHIIKSTGARTHAAKTDYNTGTLSGIVVMDYDRDGIKDILVGITSESAMLFLKGNGTGTFAQTKVNYEITSYMPAAMRSVDMNNDGFEDLICSNQNGPYLSIYTDIPNKSLTSRYNFGSMIYTNSIAVADFNNDGKKDIVTASDGEVRFAIQIAR